MNIYLVIPSYNEEGTIKKVITDLQQFHTNIIVVNDCSTDNTQAILNKLPIIVVNNTKNLGYTKTLEKGIVRAINEKAHYIITCDADGQHTSESLQKIISVIQSEKPDLVLCKRSKHNRFMEYIWGFYSQVFFGFSDPLCGMKAYKVDLFRTLGVQLETSYTIGTRFIFKAIRSGATYKEVNITVCDRSDNSRFGSAIKGNWLELRALWNVIFST